MARTKGSLGKKTIEKLKAEGKWDYNNNCPCINIEKNIPETTQIEQESNSIPEKENDSTINFIDVESEFESIEKEEENKENEENENIPKNLPLIENEPQTKTVNKSNTNIKPNTKVNKYNSCDRCGAVIYCEPRRIDSNLLIGLADYHRHTPRYINLCSKCCHELNDIFEDWLTNKGKGGNEDLKRYG